MSKLEQKAKREATRGASVSDPVQQAEQAMQALDVVTKQVLEWKHINKLESAAEYERCTQVLVSLKGQLKQADTERKLIVDPLNAVVKHVNQKVKAYTSPREELEGHLKMLVRGFLDEQRQKAIDIAEKAAKKAEKDGAKQLALDIRERAATSMPVPENGAVAFRDHWTYEVEDIDKVPREFLVLDETRIRKMAAEDAPAIKGIKWVKSTIVAVSA